MKKYKLPKNYLDWGKFETHLIFFENQRPRKIDINDFSSRIIYNNIENCAYFYQIWKQGNYPVYCLRDSLLEDIQNTDVGENLPLFEDLEIAVPICALFLPRNQLKSPHLNNYIDYLIISQEAIISEEFKYLIVWCGIDSNQQVFFGAKRIRRDGTIQQSYFSSENVEQNQAALGLRNIALQAILLLDFYPDIVEQMNSLPDKANGFGTDRAKDCLLPRWLGKERKKSQSDSANQGTGAKKSPHFRRGHWRLQPYGEGRAKTRPIRIAPTYINSQTD